MYNRTEGRAFDSALTAEALSSFYGCFLNRLRDVARSEHVRNHGRCLDLDFCGVDNAKADSLFEIEMENLRIESFFTQCDKLIRKGE
jgi:hypothetical protein